MQGPKHFETVQAEWVLKTFRRVAAMPKEDRVAFESITALCDQGESLHAKGKYAEAQPIFEKASRSAVDCSLTITPIPPAATETWR